MRSTRFVSHHQALFHLTKLRNPASETVLSCPVKFAILPWCDYTRLNKRNLVAAATTISYKVRLIQTASSHLWDAPRLCKRPLCILKFPGLTHLVAVVAHGHAIYPCSLSFKQKRSCSNTRHRNFICGVHICLLPALPRAHFPHTSSRANITSTSRPNGSLLNRQVQRCSFLIWRVQVSPASFCLC